jgi:hypothetical protein
MSGQLGSRQQCVNSRAVDIQRTHVAKDSLGGGWDEILRNEERTA